MIASFLSLSKARDCRSAGESSTRRSSTSSLLDFALHFTLTREQDPEILELLHLGQHLTPNLEGAIHRFPAEYHDRRSDSSHFSANHPNACWRRPPEETNRTTSSAKRSYSEVPKLKTVVKILSTTSHLWAILWCKRSARLDPCLHLPVLALNWPSPTNLRLMSNFCQIGCCCLMFSLRSRCVINHLNDQHSDCQMISWIPGRSEISVCLHFAQFHVWFPNMAAVKRSVISELVLVLLQKYFTCFG